MQKFVEENKINDIFGNMPRIECSAELDAIGSGIVMTKFAMGLPGAPAEMRQAVLPFEIGGIYFLKDFFKVVKTSSCI